MLVDGPYGRPPSVNSYSSVVLLAGGSGVSFTLPLLLDVISAVRRNESPVRRVLFIWSVKHRGRFILQFGYYPWSNVLFPSIDDMKWAYDDLQAALKYPTPNLSIDVRIHISRTTISLPIAGTYDYAKGKQDFVYPPMIKGPFKVIKENVVPVPPVGNIQVCLRRPDLLGLVQKEVEFAQGPISVNGEHSFVFLLPISPVNGLT